MITKFDPNQLKKLYLPPPDSHKGQNGKVLVIGGSKLFHAASLWALEIASKIVDLVFYSSIPENLSLLEKLKIKGEFRNGIVVPEGKREDYIKEADVVLIGPGMPRKNGQIEDDYDTKDLTNVLLRQFPFKKWVIDGGSLQTMDCELLRKLPSVIITPHIREFNILFKLSKAKNRASKPAKGKDKNEALQSRIKEVEEKTQEYGITILLKGKTDIVCGPKKCVTVEGGNAGMTKGGTGDVLAGLATAFFCKNDAFLASCAASYLNKKAAESLFKKVAYYYNASDLLVEIPKVMKALIKT